MKKLKLLVLSSALIMGLTACGGTTADTNSSDTTTSSAASTVNYATLANEAITNISASYDKWATSGVSNNQTLTISSEVTDATTGTKYNFAISYSLADAAKDYLSISSDGAKLVVKADSEDHSFKNGVTASASYNGTVYATKSFNIKVNAKNYIGLDKVYYKADKDSVTTRGYVQALNKNASIITIAAGENAVSLYSSNAKYYSELKKGDLVEVTGTVSIYNGYYEIKPTSITTVDDDSIAAPVDLVIDGNTDLDDAASIQSRNASFEGYLFSLAATKKNTSKRGDYCAMDATVYVGSETDGWQSISVHLESDKVSDTAIMTSWGVDVTNFTLLGTAPVKGSKVSVSGYMSWFNVAQISDAKLVSTDTWKGTIPTAPEPAIKSATIADLNKKTASETDVLYEVSGIFEGRVESAFGNGYLTDPTTGETIMVYGLTGTAGKGLAWNGLDAYTWSNPKDFLTSCADLKNGDYVTLKVMYTYYSGTSTPEIMGYLESRTASADTTYIYTASVSATNDDGATVSLSKTTGITYGEEITVNATSSKTGYVVDTIKVTDAQGKITTLTGNTFKATCVNKVEVTFKDGTVVLTDTTITASKLSMNGSSYTDYSTPIDGTTWKCHAATESGSTTPTYIQMNKGKGCYLYNTTALPSAIKSVVITFNKSTISETKINSTNCLIASGTFALTAGTTACGEISADNLAYTYTPSTTTDTYFAMSLNESNKGVVYIDSIVINFVQSAE